MEHQGFSITAIEKLRVQQLLSARYSNMLTEKGVEELGTLLAPLLAKNALQQQQFYKTYQAYIDEIKTEKKTDSEPSQTPLSWWEKYLPYLLAFLLLSGIIGFLWFSRKIHPTDHFHFKIKEKDKKEYLSTNANVKVGTHLEFKNHSEEIHCEGKEFHWRWTGETVENVIKEKPNSRHWEHRITPAKDGQTTKYVYMYTMENGVEINRDSSKITIVCSDAPPLGNIQKNVDSIVLNQPVQFSVKMESKDGYDYEWDFGDGTPKVNDINPTHRFTQMGKYLVQLKVENKLGDSPICFSTAEMEINLNPDLPDLPTYDLQKDFLSTQWEYAWATWLLILSMLGWALWNWRQWYRRPNEKELEKEKIAAAFKADWEETDDDTPYTIPFENKNAAIGVQLEQFNMSKSLRQRQEGTRLEMDVSSTIQATVEGGGFPSFQYQYNTRPTDYVFLIDLYSIESHQARLFQYLVGIWEQQDVHFDLFYYKKDLSRIWSTNGQNSFSLKELYRLLPQRRLIIFGDGYSVLNPTETPPLRPTLVNILRKWEERLLITPVPVVSWTFKEARLYQLFPIFHADLAGLLQATQFIGSGKTEDDLPPTLRKWESYLKRNDVDVSIEHDWEDLDGHEDYLEEHPEVFRWLKALMVHPKPTWNITIAIGKAIGAPVTYENLLLLARIPWLKNGNLDLDLWEEVISSKELSKEDELKARAAVKAELEAVKKRYPKGFFRREMETNLIVHDLALDPHNEHNQERAKLLMGQKYLDPFVKEELDWVVRRQVNDFEEGKEIGKTIELFLEQETLQPQQRETTPQFWQAIIFSVLSLIFLFFTMIAQSDDWYNWIDGGVPQEGVSSADSLRHFGFIKEVANAPDLAVELNNEAVDMLNGIAPTKRSLNYAPPYDNVNVLFESLSNEDKLIANHLLAAIAERKKNEKGYEMAEANLTRFLHNKGVEEYFKYTNQDSFLHKARYYFLFAKQVVLNIEEDTVGANMELDLHATHGLGLSYYYLGEMDTTCIVLKELINLSGGNYFTKINKNKYPSLRSLARKNCLREIGDFTINIRWTGERVKPLIPIIRDQITALGYQAPNFIFQNGVKYRIKVSQEENQIFGEEIRGVINSILKDNQLDDEINIFGGVLLRSEVGNREIEVEINIPDLPEPPVEEIMKIRGTVVDEEGTPLEGVQLGLLNEQISTDEKGEFEFEKRATASREEVIDFQKEGFESKLVALSEGNNKVVLKKIIVEEKKPPVVDTNSADWFLPMIRFDFNKSVIRNSEYSNLYNVATVMQQNPSIRLIAEGYTKEISSNCFNDVLAYNRAKAAIEYLVKEYGISVDRLILRYGRLDTNQTLNGFQDRVEFSVAKEEISMEKPDCRTNKNDIFISEMIRVEGGTFIMGCQNGRDQDCQYDEMPTHQVTVPSFEISQYEVTEKEFANFLTAYRDSDTKKSSSVEDFTYGNFREGSSNQPVRNVTWFGAVEYCKWLSREKGGTYRLPTEAEWEFAARGGVKMTDYKYAGGDDIDKVAVHSSGNVQEVGSKAPNLLNLYDMTGNVYEWCQDCLEKDYGNTPRDGSAANSKGSDCSRKILRGGAFNDSPKDGYLRVADRYNLPENMSGSNIGFRVVKEVSYSTGEESTNPPGKTMTDLRDGQVYKIVTIGNQTWMAENLNFEMKDSWCYNDNEDYCREFGRLYTWDAVEKACPKGWHIPSLKEWEDLFGERKLMSLNLELIYDDLIKGGKTGLDILLGGGRYSDGVFYNNQKNGYFWIDQNRKREMAIMNFRSDLAVENLFKGGIDKNIILGREAVSCRCIKD